MKEEIVYYKKEQIEPDEMREWGSLFLPVFGAIPCGRKNMIDDDLRGYLKVPMGYLGDGEYFVLRAKGDSMIDAGINDGDLVIIKKQSFAEDGKIVVALIEDEIMLKRIHWREKDNMVEFLSANKNYQPILSSDYTILGVAQKIVNNI